MNKSDKCRPSKEWSEKAVELSMHVLYCGLASNDTLKTILCNLHPS